MGQSTAASKRSCAGAGVQDAEDDVNLDLTSQRQRPGVQVGGTGQLLPGHGRGARVVVSYSGFM
jgi:hypothetical protein